MSTHNSDIVQRKQEIAGVFGRAAATYDHVGPRFFSHFGRRLVELAQIPRGAHVLDVATGRGAVLFPAAESVGLQGHITGVDLAETMVQETAQELARLGLASNAEVHQMDAECLQFPDGSFDSVLCGFALFFFPQLDRAMSEFRRVLKPQGQIALTTWEKRYYAQWNWLEEIVKAYLPAEPHAQPPGASDLPPPPVLDTPEGLEIILRTAGFTDIQIASEAATFIYATEDELWASFWSLGMRRTLERIERTTGAVGLSKFKTEVLEQVQAFKQADGIPQLFPVLFAIATKPQL